MTAALYPTRGAPAPDDPTSLVDVSPLPWDDKTSTPEEPGREPIAVSLAVRDYVLAEKQLAAKAGNPVADRLKTFLPSLTKVAETAVASLAQVAKQEERVRNARLSTEQTNAIAGLAQLDRNDARAALKVAVDAKVKEFDAYLAQEEANAATQLGVTRFTAADMEWTADLARTLQLMPARVAAPVLRRFLVADVVNAIGETERVAALRRAAALRPVIDGMVEGNANGYGDSHEVKLVLREAQAVSQDRDWYAARQRLATIARARLQLRQAAAAFIAGDGNLNSPGLNARIVRDGAESPLLALLGAA
jgi:hypothetical protein